MTHDPKPPCKHHLLSRVETPDAIYFICAEVGGCHKEFTIQEFIPEKGDRVLGTPDGKNRGSSREEDSTRQQVTHDVGYPPYGQQQGGIRYAPTTGPLEPQEKPKEECHACERRTFIGHTCGKASETPEKCSCKCHSINPTIENWSCRACPCGKPPETPEKCGCTDNHACGWKHAGQREFLNSDPKTWMAATKGKPEPKEKCCMFCEQKNSWLKTPCGKRCLCHHPNEFLFSPAEPEAEGKACTVDVCEMYDSHAKECCQPPCEICSKYVYTRADIDERIDGILSYLGIPNLGHKGFQLPYQQFEKALNDLRKKFLPPSPH